MRRAIIGLVAAVLAAGAAAAGERDVRIRRDTWGVPHILGRTDADAAYGLAWAQSEDDFATLQEAVFAARGRLAELTGPAGVESDYLVALQDVWETVRARYARDLEPKTKAVMEAYAAGATAYAKAHPEKVAPGLLPITGEDLAASTMYRGPTFYGLDDLFRRTMRPTSQRRAEVWDGVEIGSNGVAVGPKRSADGATRLLVNSHQPYVGPLAWYEAVVESREGWHVAGGFFPGGPFMLHGHNARLGWASTVDNPDLADVYQLVMHPTDRELYKLDGAWKRLSSRWVEIKVRRPDGSFETVRREVARSVHGPVVRTDHGVFAIRYAGMGEIRQNEQYFAMNKARNAVEWRAAMAKGVLPSINYVYADADGNVGYVHNGRFPVRKDGVDWSGVVPGDRSDLIWTRQRPFSGVPQIWNPKGGWTYNANNTPFSATDPADDLKPADFPKWMGLQTNMTNRAWRALETYGADSAITAEEFEAYKYDLAYSAKSDLGKALPMLLALPAGDDADLKAAQELLRGWDRRTDRESRAAALAVLTVLRMGQQPGTPPLTALKAVMAELRARFGRIDPTWGEVNRIRRGGVDLPIDGGPDIFRAVYGRPDADGRLRAVAGDTFVMFVTWEKGGKLTSRSIHQFGTATLDTASPHYADQTPLFAAMKTKPVLFTEAELAGHVAREYRPGE